MSCRKRRRVFIDSNVQGALARRILLHWVTFLFVASVAAFLLQVLTDPFRPIQEHARNLWQTQGPFLLVMAFLLPVFVVDTIKLSHRFAGPIYSLRRAMREIADGQSPRRLRFRHNDFWHDLCDDFNAMLTRVGLLDADGVAAKGRSESAEDATTTGATK
jgi:hypothetical protein